MTFHIALAGALAGCRTAPPRLPIEPAQPAVAYERVAIEHDLAPALKLQVQTYAVTDTPTGEAVAQAASAIVRDRGEPFRGRSRLPIGSRWLRAADLATWRERDGHGDPEREQLLGSAEAVSAPGLVTAIQPQRAPLPLLRLERVDDAPGALDAILMSTEDGGLSREALVIEHALNLQAAGALFVPVASLAPGGLLVVVTPAGPAEEDEVTAAGALADASAPPPVVPASPRALAWRVARDAVGARNRRPALLALVTPMQQTRAIDVLVVADERALMDVTAPMTAVDADAADAGWQLERGLWRGLLPRLERDALTPALRATVTRHLGALGSDAAALSLLLETCDDGGRFDAGILEENLIALDDRSAAVRTTAHTFLQRLGGAVPGYDPMGPRDGRRAAVRRHRRAIEEAR